MSIDFVSNERIAETSSKGNQEKWCMDGRWYKLDESGYEALAEVMISHLLEKSNVETETPFFFVRYRMERMQVHRRERTGCSSESFMKNEQNIITLAHLLRQVDPDYGKKLQRLSGDSKRLAYLADEAAEYTGLSLFPQYMALLFEIDSLFLNDDRHLNNIALLEQDGKYDYCPIFDNGAGLLSDLFRSPMDIDPRGLISSLRARPFDMTFNRQTSAVRRLWGSQLKMPHLERKALTETLEPLLPYYSPRIRDVISDRVCECILLRQKAMGF